MNKNEKIAYINARDAWDRYWNNVIIPLHEHIPPEDISIPEAFEKFRSLTTAIQETAATESEKLLQALFKYFGPPVELSNEK